MSTCNVLPWLIVSGAFYVYKSYLTSRNTTAVLKCFKDSYFRYSPIDESNIQYPEFTYDIYKQQLIFCGGGYSNYGHTSVNYCFRYVFINGNFTFPLYEILYSMTFPRQHFGLEFINGFHYAFGGFYEESSYGIHNSYFRSDCEKFKIVNWNHWEEFPVFSAPESIGYMCTVEIRNSEVYIIGGKTDTGNMCISNCVFPAPRTWWWKISYQKLLIRFSHAYYLLRLIL